MSLMKKLRTAACGLMLGAATIGTFSGCVTAWQSVGIEQRPTGVERTVTRNEGSKTVKERVFSISDPYIENGSYKNKVTESSNEITTNLQSKETIREVQKIAVEQRTDESMNVALSILGAIGGTVGGAYVGGTVDDSLDGGLMKYIGGGVGFLVGLGLGTVFPSQVQRRENFIGRGEVSAGKRIEEAGSSTRLLYANKLGANIKVGIRGNSDTYLTDNNGTIIWDNQSGWDATKEGLEKRLYEVPLVQEIKPETLNLLRKRLTDAISKKVFEFTLETREQSTNDLERIANCSKAIKLSGYELTDNAIYNIVRQFINEKINPSIVSLDFIVRDNSSHTAIEGCNFEYATDAPSKSALAERYFTGDLADFAAESIKDYLIGSSIAEGCSDTFRVMVYSPSNISVEFTNPDYYFVSGKIPIRGNTQKKVYMVDKGSKVRIETQKESMGRIE